jgi:hypothetical protein
MAADEAACPPSFLCPVTTEIMGDPVLTADGHTFDRRFVEQWLQTHDTSPLHGGVLTSKALVPNFALRNSIDEWCEPPRPPLPGGHPPEFGRGEWVHGGEEWAESG